MGTHKTLFVAAALSLGLMTGPIQTATAADTVMKIGDNLAPLPVFPSTINSSPFPPGTEMRLVDPTGQPGGGPPPHKDIFSGTEEWVFDMTSNEMKSVANTAMTPGATSFPGSACPPGCEGISQNFPFFFAPFGFLAPTVGGLVGNAYGPATLNVTGADTFEVHFPVLEAQWADTYFTLGSAGNQGVTFNCSGVPSASFHCTAEHTIQLGEDPSFAGFIGWTLQIDMGAAVAVAAAIDIPGGASQECSSSAGSAITMNAITSTPGGGTIESISWDVDGAFFATGPSISPVLALGAHTVDLTVTTTAGDTAVSSAVVTVEDTTSPNLVAAFKDSRTGQVITSVSGPQTSFVEISLDTTDLCDPEPQVTSANLTPTYMTGDGEVLEIRPKKGGVNLPTTALTLDATAEDGSGNTGAASANLEVVNN